MTVAKIQDIYPLTPLQQGILFHHLYNPESGMYVEQLGCTLRGHLNVAALEQAWQRVVERHPALRVSFVWKRVAEPLQVAHQRVELTLAQQDWRGLPPEEQARRLQEYLKEERRHGFDPAKAPLMRLMLIRMGEECYHFVLNHSDLLVDGWSVALVFEEVFTLYEALSRGTDLSLPPRPPYADYIAWLQRQDTAKAEAFWRETLKGFASPTPLLVDRSVTKETTAKGEYDEVSVLLSEALTAAVQSFARRHQLTPNTLLQGAWALLLSRYSGEADVVFGSVTSGRPVELAGVERMIGTFINTLPMRAQAHPEDALLPWLAKFQEKQLEMRQYEYSPLVKVQGWSQVPRDLPLFESLAVLENYPVDASLRELRGSVEIEQVRVIERTNYPLMLVIVPGPAFSLRIIYAADRFRAGTITRLLGHYQTLLAGMVSNPQQSLSQLPLLTEAERRQIVVEWNRTSKDRPDRCVHQLFEAQVRRTPDAVAAVFEDEQITFRELNRRANRLAWHLAERGIGAECIVGLLAERNFEYLIALLAILKAGGAFLPLDPRHTAQRLAQVLDQSESRLVLATGEFLPVLEQATVALAPDRRPAIHRIGDALALPGRDDDLSLRCTLANLAYVMFTSGSTGLPKGALIEHVGMWNHICAKIEDMQMTRADIVAQNSPQSFDILVWQFLAALVCGGKVHILGDETVYDSVKLLECVQRGGITIFQLVPAQLRAIVQETRSRGEPYPALPALRWVVPTGEALATELCRQWLSLYPSIPLLNTYGATECSDDTCHYSIPRPPALDYPLPIMTIGRPVRNMQLYVLDAYLMPVPVGVIGEIYEGGIGVGRGYLKDAVKTAAAFVPNPFLQELGARLYRSGDQGRYLPDGTVEFLGRIDHQTKIRGLRVELGEIEAVLSRHTAVREAVVMAREHPSGDQRLVAYVVPQEGEVLAASEVRRFLQEHLLDYMVPSAFVKMDAMPLTPNGKLDRRALPEPEWMQRDLEDAFVAPRNPLEQVLAGLWEEALGVEQVGIHDNFFELGGHSLLVTRIMSQLGRVLQLELPLLTFFQDPTVAGFAAALLQIPGKRQEIEHTAEILVKVAELSDEQVEQTLAERAPLTRGIQDHGA